MERISNTVSAPTQTVKFITNYPKIISLMNFDAWPELIMEEVTSKTEPKVAYSFLYPTVPLIFQNYLKFSREFQLLIISRQINLHCQKVWRSSFGQNPRSSSSRRIWTSTAKGAFGWRREETTEGRKLNRMETGS